MPHSAHAKDATCRLCDPYITEGVLSEAFGDLAAEVSARYLVLGPYGRYELRPNYRRCGLALSVMMRPTTCCPALLCNYNE